MHKNENRPGYKKTKVGWIPQEWTYSRFDEISNVVRGGSPRPAGSPLYFNGDFIPWITVADVTNSKEAYLSATKTGLTEAGSKQSRIFPANSLLLANSGATLGVPKITLVEACANDGIAGFLNLSAKTNKIFLYYFLYSKTEFLRDQLAPGLGQPNLNTEIIGSLNTPLPPLPEQEAIAEVLECWDRGIRNLELKIVKKRLIKKGLMQRLLSGRTRLPGFSKVWENTNFLEVFEIQKGTKLFQVQTSEYRASGQYPIVDQGQKRIVAYTNIDNLYSNIPVIVFGDHTRIVKWIDFPFVIGADGTQLINATEKTDLRFGYFLISNLELTALGYSRHLKLLKESEFALPPIEEQRAIAEVLSAADGELEALERKLALWRDQKKYLLNNLVTGTIRLPRFISRKDAKAQ